MAKAKTQKQTTAAKKAPAASKAPTAASEPAAAPIPGLSSREKTLLLRASRFLLNIASPGRAARALREGYTTDEHKEGWRLWHLASGGALSLDHWLDDLHAAEQPDKGATLALLKQLDDFENRWFPRTRTILRRAVPREHRDTVEAVFFKNLAQQPLGPGVIQSVGTFLQRVDELPTSKLPGAKQLAAALTARGLTPELRASARALIEQLAAVNESLPAPSLPSAQARKKAADERAAALEDLADWFNDWRTTLAPAFSGSDAVALGFVASKGGRRAEADEDEEDESGGPTPDDDA